MQADNIYAHPHLIVGLLQHRLAERADPSYAEWYRHNVKPTAPVRGVRMQDLRHLVMAWHQEWQQHLSSIPLSIQLDVTFLLFNAEYVDDRLAAMVYLDEVLIPAQLVNPDLLSRLSTLFPPGLISDFKACDHFAAKVLQPLLIRYGSQVSDQLRYWFGADSVWQARAALSALTPLASDAIYDDLLFYGCGVVLARPEEEAKSIVGSALRALGKVRPELVESFLSDNTNLINSNAACLNKATSFLEPGRAQHFREQRRMLLAWNAQVGSAAVAGSSAGHIPVSTSALPGTVRDTAAKTELSLATFAPHAVPRDLPPGTANIPVAGGMLPTGVPETVGTSTVAAAAAAAAAATGPTADTVNMNMGPPPQYGTVQHDVLGTEASGGDIIGDVGRAQTEVGAYLHPSAQAGGNVQMTGGMQLSDHPSIHLGEHGPPPPMSLLPLGSLDPVSLPLMTADDGRGTPLNVAHGRIQRTDSATRRRGGRRSRPSSVTASPAALAAAMAEEHRGRALAAAAAAAAAAAVSREGQEVEETEGRYAGGTGETLEGGDVGEVTERNGSGRDERSEHGGVGGRGNISGGRTGGTGGEGGGGASVG